MLRIKSMHTDTDFRNQLQDDFTPKPWDKKIRDFKIKKEGRAP
jgi:hypothetical protein